MASGLRPFHLAIPVNDLTAAEAFYTDLLGCEIGRRSETWIDFNFFGHQLVAHLSPEECGRPPTGEVDGMDVPVRHFGVVLQSRQWRGLADRLQKAGAAFVIEPGVRFAGAPGEQQIFFVLDPAGNALEFKCFKKDAHLFAT